MNPRNFFQKIFLVPVIIVLLAGCKTSLFDRHIPEINFDQDWEFCISTDSVDQIMRDDGIEWKKVSLPHTPVIEPLIVNDQWQGICWYRKSFDLPEDFRGKNLFLRFEGAMNVADVWINGKKQIHHLGGYLPFTIDFSKDALPGKTNEVLVRLDNRDNPVTGPKPLKMLDYNTYGGLYRDVFLIVKNEVYVTDPMLAIEPGGGGVFVRYPQVSDSAATLSIMTEIKHGAEDAVTCYIIHELWKDRMLKGSTTSRKIRLGPGSLVQETNKIEIKRPELWFPDSPERYQLVTKIISQGEILDEITTTLGIRRFEITADRFAINGKEMFLRGVNRHQEYPYIGYALSNQAQYRDAVRIKEAGFDYVRLSHYPQSPAFMDACDELGLLVLDAIPGWQYFSEDPAFQEQVLRTCHDMIRRDRNHPCVLTWEVSLNESWMPEAFIDRAVAAAREEYPGDQCFTAGWMNYGYDIYLQARQHRLEHYKAPGKPYIVSEYGDWEYYAMNAGLNQDRWQGLLPDERSSRQLLSDGEKRLLQQALNIQEAHNDNYNTPAFADGYWVMFDYNRGYTDDLEASGIMSINRLPKFSYYFFRSQRDADKRSENYSSGPMTYLATYWNEHSPLDIHVYSNCEEVELQLNGTLLARQKPDTGRICNHLDHPPFTFRLDKFTKGTLTAIGYIDGHEASSYSVTTPGAPFSLRLKYNDCHHPPVRGVNDVIFVYAEIVDQDGTVVPVNGTRVNFNVSGDAELIDISGVVSEAGVAAALLRIGQSAGTVTVSVTAAGLGGDSLEIPVQ